MSSFPDMTNRPIKKPRTSYGPDVYPQDPKQKEDELTPHNVKMGFSNSPVTSEEYGSAKHTQWNKDKLSSLFNGILMVKVENNSFSDQGKKKLQINIKDNFWLAAQKSKSLLEAWFTDLAGTKPLHQLAKKVPIFNKKDEIFVNLCDHNVSMVRAAWFIKMTNAYNMAIAEARARSRTKTFDPFIDWAQAITKHLKEQLNKMMEHHQGGSGSSTTTSFLTAGPTGPTMVDIDTANKFWSYGTQLAKHLYEEGLIDHQEFIQWLLDLLEKEKIKDDTVLKLVVAQILRYVSEFSKSALLARKLAYFCCKKIAHFCQESGCPSPRTQSPLVTTNANGSLTTTSGNPPSSSGSGGSTGAAGSGIAAVFAEYANCPQHRSLLLSLASVVHSIVLQCPSALVWHNLGDDKASSVLYGSPLDLLPCSPSCLPMAPGLDTAALRSQIRAAEHQIRLRSLAAELHWSSDKYQQSATGQTISKVLHVLEVLDRHNFDKVESGSLDPLDKLYNQIFSVLHSKENEPPIGEEAILNLLCEWAVSTFRSGEHRAVIVAKLIEKRQAELQAEKYAESDTAGGGDDKASDAGSDMMVPSGPLPFQALLMAFLDTKAPVLEEHGSAENKQAFSNLILLFSELIRHDVFSHDAYMCTLVSRGDLSHVQAAMATVAGGSALQPPVAAVDTIDLASVKSDTNVREMKMELENQNLDSDFDIFAFKSSPEKPSPGGGGTDAPASVKSVVDQGPLSVHAPTPGHPHTPVQARTPGAPHTPARTPGGAPPHTPGHPHTPGVATTPGMAHTPGPAAHSPRVLPPPPPPPTSSSAATSSGPDLNLKRSLKHLCYATHFPIPQDEFSAHETNQRMVMLYGFGKTRDDAKHAVKKVTKEVLKLYSKKNCVDVTIGDVRAAVRKDKKKDKDGAGAGPVGSAGTGGGGDSMAASFENTFNKFRKLSYFDQHAVTATCASQVLELVSSFVAGSSIYLPVIDNLSYLLYLMENALNIGGLLDFSVQLLKELSDVEAGLAARGAPLAGGYTTTLCLHIVAVLRKYQAYLFVNRQLTCQAFENLRKIVRHVPNPNDCTSAERCILAYLYDLFTSCHYVKSKFSELFGAALAKLKQVMHSRIMPSASNLRWEPSFLESLINNPRQKLTQGIVRQLQDPANRYSFVCNAVLTVCTCQNVEKLNDVSILCAELTACCNSLSSEWLGVLKALCCSESQSACGYYDILTQIDVGDLSIHDSLAVFTSILISRHCFSLADLVLNVALHSLVAACLPTGGGGDPEAETGARLTCHLLLRLLQTKRDPGGSGGGGHSPRGEICVRSTCDSHLLEAAHDNLTVGAVVAVLKAMLMLADSSNTEPKDSPPPKKEEPDIIASMLQSLEDDDLGGYSIMGSSSKAGSGLSDYAKSALKQICTQDWVREKFLKDPESLFNTELLLDNMLSRKQAQQLVQMICYPHGVPPTPALDDEDDDDDSEQKRNISRILMHMDQWSLRVAWLELELMFKLVEPSEMEPLLESTARCTIEVFQAQTDRITRLSETSPQLAASWQQEQEKDAPIWLIAPLISKLSATVQGRVLKSVGEELETGNNFWTAKNAKEKEKCLQKSISLLGYQPFLSLVLTCLKGQDEQREGLLKSIHEQLEKFVNNTKEPQDRGIPTDDNLKHMMQESLQLRLSLVGGMFDTIQRINTLTQDWAILLSQLMSHSVVEIGNNAQTFIMVLDMLCVLINGALVTSETSDKSEDRKMYQSLMRKLKREIGDKKNDSMDIARQLLPLSKKYHEILTTDNYNIRGKTIEIMDPKKGGLQLAVSKQKVSPWEILEGHKNPAPLSLAWFGAQKMERKPLWYEEQHRLLVHHSHSRIKPASHYLDAPPLPPEDLEPPPEPKKEEVVEAKPSSVHHTAPTPAQGTEEAKKKTKNKRRQPPARMNTPTHPPSFAGSMPMPPGGMYGRPEMPPYGQTGPVPGGGASWNTPYGPPQPNLYGAQQPLGPAGPRFVPPSQNPKAQLASYLSQRRSTGMYPTSTGVSPGGGMAGAGQPGAGPGGPYSTLNMQQRSVIRNRIMLTAQNRQMMVRGGPGGGATGGPMDTGGTMYGAPGMGQPRPGPHGFPGGAGGGAAGMMGAQNMGGGANSYGTGYSSGMQGAGMTGMTQQGGLGDGAGGYSGGGGGSAGYGQAGGMAGLTQPGAGGGHMGAGAQQPGYINTQQYPQATRYGNMGMPMNSSGSMGQAPISMQSAMGPGGNGGQMASYSSQMGGASGAGGQPAGYSGMSGGMAGLTQQQRQQQQLAQLRQQQMMAMQQQQQQQQQQAPQPQQMYGGGGIQRQMSNPGQPQPPSYNQYGQY